MDIISLLTVTFLIAAALLSIQLFQIFREQQRSKSHRIARKIPYNYLKKKPSPSKPQGNSLLRKRLLILLNGDNRTAQRLVNKLCAENPRRSVDWCIEKAIYDLERDRH